MLITCHDTSYHWCDIFSLHVVSTSRSAIDERFWLCWYNYEGAIRSSGFSFIEDFPRYATLLLIVQRFELDDWGFCTELFPDNTTAYHGQQLPKTLEVKLGETPVIVHMRNEDFISHRYTFRGRCAQFRRVTSVNHPDKHFVIKSSHPDATQTAEGLVIEAAQKALCEKNPDLTGHLPTTLDQVQLSYSTQTIRSALGLRTEDDERKGRVIRVCLFEELSPIEKMEPKKFVSLWHDAVQGQSL